MSSVFFTDSSLFVCLLGKSVGVFIVHYCVVDFFCDLCDNSSTTKKWKSFELERGFVYGSADGCISYKRLP